MTQTKGTKNITAPATSEDAKQALKKKHKAEFRLKLNWEKVEFSVHKSLMKVSRTFFSGIDECIPENEVHLGHHGKAFVSQVNNLPGAYYVNIWFKPDLALRDYKNHCELKYHKDVLKKIAAAIDMGGEDATEVVEKFKPKRESLYKSKYNPYSVNIDWDETIESAITKEVTDIFLKSDLEPTSGVILDFISLFGPVNCPTLRKFIYKVVLPLNQDSKSINSIDPLVFIASGIFSITVEKASIILKNHSLAALLKFKKPILLDSSSSRPKNQSITKRKNKYIEIEDRRLFEIAAYVCSMAKSFNIPPIGTQKHFVITNLETKDSNGFPKFSERNLQTVIPAFDRNSNGKAKDESICNTQTSSPESFYSDRTDLAASQFSQLMSELEGDIERINTGIKREDETLSEASDAAHSSVSPSKTLEGLFTLLHEEAYVTNFGYNTPQSKNILLKISGVVETKYGSVEPTELKYSANIPDMVMSSNKGERETDSIINHVELEGGHKNTSKYGHHDAPFEKNWNGKVKPEKVEVKGIPQKSVEVGVTNGNFEGKKFMSEGSQTITNNSLEIDHNSISSPYLLKLQSLSIEDENLDGEYSIDEYDEEEAYFSLLGDEEDDDQFLSLVEYLSDLFPKINKSELKFLLKTSDNIEELIESLFIDEESSTLAETEFQYSMDNFSPQYSNEVYQLKDIFPNQDLDFLKLLLSENDGDVNSATNALLTEDVRKIRDKVPEKNNQWASMNASAEKLNELLGLNNSESISYLHANRQQFVVALVDIIKNHKKLVVAPQSSNIPRGGRVQRGKPFRGNLKGNATSILRESYKYDYETPEAQEIIVFFNSNPTVQEIGFEFLKQALIFFEGDDIKVIQLCGYIIDSGISYEVNRLMGINIKPKIKMVKPDMHEIFKAYNNRASNLNAEFREINNEKLETFNKTGILDLHRLKVVHALQTTKQALSLWWNSEVELRINNGVLNKFGSKAEFAGTAVIITGRGLHSTSGISILRKEVLRHLKHNSYVFTENVGSFEVTGKRSRGV